MRRRSRASSSPTSSRSTSTAGRSSIFITTPRVPSASVIRCGTPIGVQPWDRPLTTIYSELSRTPDTPPSDTRETPSRSEEHTSELQSLMRISYAVFCLKKKKKQQKTKNRNNHMKEINETQTN